MHLPLGSFNILKEILLLKGQRKISSLIKKNNKILENDLIKVASDSLAIAKINKKVTIKIEEN
jgi:histone H3/H4